MLRKLFFSALAMTAMAIALLLPPAHVEAREAQQPATGTALTIYNQNFAVVRQMVPLDLSRGLNPVSFTRTTAYLEPDSVILRDPAGRHALQVLEQNYRNDPVSEALLLSLFEGQTIDFEVRQGDRVETVRGKIIRSGYAPAPAAYNQYGQPYQQAAHTQPIIEVDGRLMFGLPGRPLFPSLGQDTILEPTLHWLLATDRPGRFDAELSYVTSGMSWQSDYNVVAPESGDVIDIIGWVTMRNYTGRTFDDAQVKLMAGDISKLQPQLLTAGMAAREQAYKAADAMAPAVTERSFDEYHLYDLARRVTLRDRETKQVEFLRATGVRSQRLYVYDGAFIDANRYRGWDWASIRQDQSYGTQSNPKVWVMQEFKNSEANGLGMPLPRGRLRFYRRDKDGRLEFTGENMIDHTPKDETVRVYTGNAFDIVGERRRTDYRINTDADWLDESFEIKVRNHKSEPVEVRVVEHLYRWTNWRIVRRSHDFLKTDAQTAEFRVTIPAGGEAVINYTVHYSW